jgi:hypothetical protein
VQRNFALLGMMSHDGDSRVATSTNHSNQPVRGKTWTSTAGKVVKRWGIQPEDFLRLADNGPMPTVVMAQEMGRICDHVGLTEARELVKGQLKGSKTLTIDHLKAVSAIVKPSSNASPTRRTVAKTENGTNNVQSASATASKPKVGVQLAAPRQAVFTDQKVSYLHISEQRGSTAY